MCTCDKVPVLRLVRAIVCSASHGLSPAQPAGRATLRHGFNYSTAAVVGGITHLNLREDECARACIQTRSSSSVTPQSTAVCCVVSFAADCINTVGC